MDVKPLLMTTAGNWEWPTGKTAAVSLTYDDGNANNLDVAIPQLEDHGFRGTFYLTTGPTYRSLVGRWAEAFQRGHEIGNHSVRHPARADGYPQRPSWLVHALEDYSPDDIDREVSDAADILDRDIGEDGLRSYAYPCSHTAIGVPPDRESYRRAVSRRHRCARTGRLGPGPCLTRGINDPRTVDLELIDSVGFYPGTFANWREVLELGLHRGHWTVLMFHGTGGPSHEVTREDHLAIIQWLAGHDVWVAPLRDVAESIARRRSSERQTFSNPAT